MNKSNRTKTIVKTEKMDQRKLSKVANRFGISPLSVRELQLGFPETIPERAANKLIKEGFAKESKDELRPHQTRVDSLTEARTKPTERIVDESKSNLVDVDSTTTEENKSTVNVVDESKFCITDNDENEEL